jgi:hypothetical protein
MEEDISKMQNQNALLLEKEKAQMAFSLRIFKCANRVCELEFPIFQELSDAITYCPKCSGAIIKPAGIMRVSKLD